LAANAAEIKAAIEKAQEQILATVMELCAPEGNTPEVTYGNDMLEQDNLYDSEYSNIEESDEETETPNVTHDTQIKMNDGDYSLLKEVIRYGWPDGLTNNIIDLAFYFGLYLFVVKLITNNLP